MNLDQFSQAAQEVLNISHYEAVRLRHSYLRPEHVLLGLIRRRGGVTSSILESLGADPHHMAELVEGMLGEGQQNRGNVRLSHQGDWLLHQATSDARSRGQQLVGEEHLLRALICQTDGEKAGPLQLVGITAETLDEFFQRKQADEASSSKEHSPVARIPLSLGDRHADSSVISFMPDSWWLANERLLGFIFIQEGSFWMGSDQAEDRLAYPEETPLHQVYLPDFYISRYPVTTAQFQAFARDTNYSSRQYANMVASPYHPATRVTWHDALAYCEWLGNKLRSWSALPKDLSLLLRETSWEITLPSEAEWEKAARGTDGRLFPWGNDPAWRRANCAEARLGSTVPVGSYPIGSSPYGVQDMSGNVWEWTRSLWGENHESASFRYPYVPTDGREDLSADDEFCRVMRGAGYLDTLRHARCSSRSGGEPSGMDFDVGFRIALTRPRSTQAPEELISV